VISTAKKISYGVALLASSALFANELLKATRSDAPVGPVERSADGGESNANTFLAEGDADLSVDELAIDPEAQLSHGGATSTPEVGVVLQSLESALQRMDAARRAGPTPRVGAEERRREERAPAAQGQDAHAEEHLRESGSPARRDEAELRARLATFLAQSPLTGVLRGRTDSAAMFGGRILRVGERLLGDDGELLRIEEHGLVVSLAGVELRIDVPPISSRSATAPEVAAAPAPVSEPAPELAPPPSPVLNGENR